MKDPITPIALFAVTENSDVDVNRVHVNLTEANVNVSLVYQRRSQASLERTRRRPLGALSRNRQI